MTFLHAASTVWSRPSASRSGPWHTEVRPSRPRGSGTPLALENDPRLAHRLNVWQAFELGLHESLQA